MHELLRKSVFSLRRCCTSNIHRLCRTSAACCHHRLRCTTAVYNPVRTVTSPAVPCAASGPEISSSASVLSSDNCPTAAVLVDTSGSALITLPYCLVDVQERVRASLRQLLVERLVAPLITVPLVKFCREGSGDVSRLANTNQYGTTAFLASTVVHRVTQSPSTLRYLAFSHQNPRLRHSSWTPLWSARLATSTLSTVPCTPHGESSVEMDATSTSLNESASSGFGVDVELVNQCALEELVQPCLGEVTPLLGCDACGSFLAVTPNACTTTPATHQSITTAPGSSATCRGLSPPLKSSSLAVTFWECCRVDPYIPSYVQVQAAVRHLLRRRRPTVCFTANALTARPASRMFATRFPPARPVAVIAVVAPDHLTAVYLEFIDILAQEWRQHQRQRHKNEEHSVEGPAVCDSPVCVLLFNSKGLVGECAAA